MIHIIKFIFKVLITITFVNVAIWMLIFVALLMWDNKFFYFAIAIEEYIWKKKDEQTQDK